MTAPRVVAAFRDPALGFVIVCEDGSAYERVAGASDAVAWRRIAPPIPAAPERVEVADAVESERGQWRCQVCREPERVEAINYTNETRCYRCGSPRPA